jgi:hypothetical protein
MDLDDVFAEFDAQRVTAASVAASQLACDRLLRAALEERADPLQALTEAADAHLQLLKALQQEPALDGGSVSSVALRARLSLVLDRMEELKRQVGTLHRRFLCSLHSTLVAFTPLLEIV